MAISGSSLIHFYIQGLKFESMTLIASTLREPLLLGLPWLVQEGAVIDLLQNILHIGKEQRLLVPLLPHCRNTFNKDAIVKQSIKCDLADESQDQLKTLILNHAHVFDKVAENSAVAQTYTVCNQIKLLNHKPIKLPLYRYSTEKRLEIDRQIQEMFEAGIIEPFISSNFFSVVMA